MSIYFYNKEPIDLAALTILGVTVKDSDSAIGYFGTGLKFAISTLLRTGHSVEIFVSGKKYKFSIKPTEIRGQQFDIVTMNKKELGFTTKMGRDWEVWQAYRELHSNCLDENGEISNQAPDEEYGTIIKVSGSQIEATYHDRHNIFIESKPISVSGVVEIHKGSGSQDAYYRGVKAHNFNLPALYRYNVTSGETLTEDRTIKHSYNFKDKIEKAVIQCEDQEVISRIVLSDKTNIERLFDFHHEFTAPSEAFLKVVERNRSNYKLNESAIRQWEDFTKESLDPKVFELTAFDVSQFNKAQALLKQLSCHITLDDFYPIEDLGIGCYGRVQEQKIFICKKAFDLGYRFLASTLYEEWLHLNHGYDDMSRELQNLLFERLFCAVEKSISIENEQPSVAEA